MLASVCASSACALNGSCPVYECGSNSPELYGHKLGPMSTLGAPNQNGVRIVPGTLLSSCSATPLTLRIGNGELTGEDGSGAIVCAGAQLIDANFEVLEQGVPRRLRVADRAEVSTWERDSSLRRMVPVFSFQIQDGQPVPGVPGSGWRPLCQPSRWMEQWQLENLVEQGEVTPVRASPVDDTLPTFTSPTGMGGLPWGQPSVHAVVVQGEAYNGVGSIARSGAEWISIGCAGRAIAKMRLLGLDPMCSQEITGGPPGAVCGGGQRRTPGRQREATLKMITARYRDNRSHTRQGTSLMWFSTDGVRYFGDPAVDSPRVGPIEARWRRDGAQCVSHLRVSQPVDGSLQTATAVRNDEVKRLKAIRGSTLRPCKRISRQELLTPSPGLRREGLWWVTLTYDHVPHPGEPAMPASIGAPPRAAR